MMLMELCATSLLIRYFNHINQKHFFIFLIELMMVMALVKNFSKINIKKT